MASGRARFVRLIPVALAGCALAALVVQNAMVAALSATNPDTAASAWPGHPTAELALATRQIAFASGKGQPIAPATFALVDRVAGRAPLEPQPFIVAGIRAQLAGQVEKADRAFAAARLRDPRSLPARYFLASSRLRRGDVQGLRDIAAITRLEPSGGQSLVPYLADLARRPETREAMLDMFRNSPGIRTAVLTVMAGDPSNARLVVALGQTRDPQDAPWLRTALDTLVANRRYGEARALWERISRARSAGLFDGDFRNPSPLPPFNWELTSSSLGLAERRSGRLQVMFYGLDSGTLARQLLLLPPGRYRLNAPSSSADGSGALHWLVRCDQGAGEITRAPVGQGGLTFTVPAGCPAQWLELNGRASDFGRQSDTAIGPVALSRVSS
jgi:hypothetical protein